MNTCIVIGNGPSLNNVPLDFLNAYPTFGSNRVYLKYTPTYYAAVNPLVIGQYRDEIAALETIKYLPEPMDGAYLLRRRSGALVFCTEPPYIHEGWTVTFVLLQIAYWLKFDTVLLVGVDHRYTFQGAPNEQRTMNGSDPNHFDPAYFQGAQWNNPDLKNSERAYRLADIAYRQAGRRIVNLGPDSALDVFEKGKIGDW